MFYNLKKIFSEKIGCTLATKKFVMKAIIRRRRGSQREILSHMSKIFAKDLPIWKKGVIFYVDYR